MQGDENLVDEKFNYLRKEWFDVIRRECVDEILHKIIGKNQPLSALAKPQTKKVKFN